MPKVVRQFCPQDAGVVVAVSWSDEMLSRLGMASFATSPQGAMLAMHRLMSSLVRRAARRRKNPNWLSTCTIIRTKQRDNWSSKSDEGLSLPQH
jgi:hypothetical protein